MNFETGVRCSKCGLNHDAYGFAIVAGLLHRRASEARHLLRKLNAWGFSERILTGHPDVNAIMITCADSGRIYRADRKTFDENCERVTLDGLSGPQLILSLRFWKCAGASKPKADSIADDLHQLQPSVTPADRRDLEAVQQELPAGAIYYKPASEPRPRRRLRRGH